MAELRHQIPINASPERVFAALATPAGLLKDYVEGRNPGPHWKE
jgi:uncharacterized protein YndB with AHSA1/START domain